MLIIDVKQQLVATDTYLHYRYPKQSVVSPSGGTPFRVQIFMKADLFHLPIYF